MIKPLDPAAFERRLRLMRKATRRRLKDFALVKDPKRQDAKWLQIVRAEFLILGLTTPDIIKTLVTRPTRRGPAISPEVIVNLILGSEAQEGRIWVTPEESEQEDAEEKRRRRKERRKGKGK